jgi:Ca2+-binding EF-hand superfamily protein
MLPLLAVAAQGPVPASNVVTVTGRGGVPFISPMGEPIRARTPNEDTLARWFGQVDLNRDGVLTSDEMAADATRYFAVLDTNNDGQIDPDELVRYEWQVAPEIQVNSRFRHARAANEKPEKTAREDRDQGTGGGDRYGARADDGPQGAARYALLNMPEPVAAADADLNRSISLAEFRQAAIARFQLLDKAHQGRLTLQQLAALKPVIEAARRRKHRDDDPDARVGVPLPPGG